jgi:hypothetical protein
MHRRIKPFNVAAGRPKKSLQRQDAADVTMLERLWVCFLRAFGSHDTRYFYGG